MAAVVTNLLYFGISAALVVAVGQALSRSGRAYLHEAFGGRDGAALAVSRLLVMTFYLLGLGFVALTAPSWSHVAGPGQAAALLSGRIGLLLLVLGALHVGGTLAIARARRNTTWAAPSESPADDEPAPTALWRPRRVH